ncbi:MAG: hypothetical protein K2M64_00845 [Clostridia bacterium]|nr:hypothetical protein [Clostridia bacterium]
MKRFLVVAVLTVIIIGVMLYFIPQSMQADVLNYSQYNAQISIYCRSTTCNSIDTGMGKIVTCNSQTLKQTLSNCNQVDGISVSFDGVLQDVDDVFNRLNATLISMQQFDDLLIICCNSPRIKGGVTVDGNSVNVQIAYCDGKITVGYPLILGSY